MSIHHSTDLLAVLLDLGVAVKRAGDREITGKCPVHRRVTGHEDSNPSWSMNAESGLWLCFSCGARGTLSMLINELSNGSVDTFGVQKMLVTHGLNRLLSPKQQEIEHQFDPTQFFSFSRVSDKKCYMRGLDPDIVFSYGVRWNSQNKSWAIPIFDTTGILRGWQEKKVGHVRNYPIGVEKSTTLFGIERFRSKTAILVESPLDVIRFAGVFDKPQALASFGAQVSTQQLRLLTAIADSIIIAMDNDKAGKEASKRIMKNLGTPRRGTRWWNYSSTDAKDIGDMTDDEIEQGLKTATVLPPWVS
jgi:5S rRNA maturation endonuclease (ribonuclease M5)